MAWIFLTIVVYIIGTYLFFKLDMRPSSYEVQLYLVNGHLEGKYWWVSPDSEVGLNYVFRSLKDDNGVSDCVIKGFHTVKEAKNWINNTSSLTSKEKNVLLSELPEVVNGLERLF